MLSMALFFPEWSLVSLPKDINTSGLHSDNDKDIVFFEQRKIFKDHQTVAFLHMHSDYKIFDMKYKW